ncbi:hypothetical protein AUP68_06739 [Ilyonectria robusta]
MAHVAHELSRLSLPLLVDHILAPRAAGPKGMSTACTGSLFRSQTPEDPPRPGLNHFSRFCRLVRVGSRQPTAPASIQARRLHRR